MAYDNKGSLGMERRAALKGSREFLISTSQGIGWVVLA